MQYKYTMILPLIILLLILFILYYSFVIYSPHKIDHSINNILPCYIGSKNCVSTNSLENETSIEPIIYKGNNFEGDIKQIMSQNFISNLVYYNNNYYHFEVISPIMRYRDDLELQLKGNKIEIRSKSRVGISDMGANKARVEKLRGLIENI